jgi:hypothetical protein
MHIKPLRPKTVVAVRERNQCHTARPVEILELKKISRAFTNRHRGSGRPLSPATPPDMRVRIGRFRGLRIASEQAR